MKEYGKIREYLYDLGADYDTVIRVFASVGDVASVGDSRDTAISKVISVANSEADFCREYGIFPSADRYARIARLASRLQ